MLSSVKKLQYEIAMHILVKGNSELEKHPGAAIIALFYIKSVNTGHKLNHFCFTS